MGVEKRSFDVQETLQDTPEALLQEMKELKTKITLDNEPGKVEKLSSGRVLLPYTRKGEKRNFLIEKTGKDEDGKNTVEI